MNFLPSFDLRKWTTWLPLYTDMFPHSFYNVLGKILLFSYSFTDSYAPLGEDSDWGGSDSEGETELSDSQ